MAVTPAPPPRRGDAGVTDETVRSYDCDAAAYVARTAAVPDSVRAALENAAGRLGPGTRVIEIGGDRGETWLELSAVRDGVSP